MFVQLGQRQSGTDVVDLLSECHGRIRRFLEIAARLAAARDPDPAAVSDAAGQVRRYFAEAFPLHLADEEELVLPALAGQVDDALATMHADHSEHASLVTEMLEVCATLQREPRQFVAVASRLAAATTALHAALEPHLALEERVIFPALRALPDARRAAIKDAMRKRRDDALAKRA